MKESLQKVLTIVFVVGIEFLLINWNTNPFLMRWDEPVSVEEAWITNREGRRAVGELDTVTTLEQIKEKSYIAPFFFKAKDLEPTGIYKLLSVEYKGIVRKGRTVNIFPRSMYTTGTFLPKVYRGMYGQFYKATLYDGSNVLVLIGCNDEEIFLEEGYSDVVAGYVLSSPQLLSEENRKDIPEELITLDKQMDILGYINMGDHSWAKRHDFGLFMMNFMKLVIAVLGAYLILVFISMFLGKNETEGKQE